MDRRSVIASSPSTAHGPDHSGCPTCDPDGTRASRGGRGVSVTRVRARGEELTVVQVVGNLFVCSRANGSCCCGWIEKDRMPFDNTLWSDEWERRRLRNRVHLTFVGCLGPCVVGNNALLQIHGRSVWFKDLNDPGLAGRVFDYVEASLAAGSLAPVPDELRGHLYERYLTPIDAQPVMTFGLDAADVEAANWSEQADPLGPRPRLPDGRRPRDCPVHARARGSNVRLLRSRLPARVPRGPRGVSRHAGRLSRARRVSWAARLRRDSGRASGRTARAPR